MDNPPIRLKAMLVAMRSGSQTIDMAPPRAIHDDGGGGGGWAWLLTARGIIEAELVKGVLESEGIVPVLLDNRDPSPGAWLFLAGNVNALVRIFVPASLLDAARLTLLEAGLGEAESLPQPKPEPASARGWVWWVTVVLIVATFIIATWRASVI
jgi:hypothetical protein